MLFRSFLVVLGLMILPQVWGQDDQRVKDTRIPYTIADRDMIRETIILMRQGFEDARKERAAIRLALESQIKANREILEAQIKGNATKINSLDKRLAFIQNLMITLFGLIISQIAYSVWQDQKRNKRIALKTEPNPQDTISRAEFQRILKRLEKLEQDNKKEEIFNA